MAAPHVAGVAGLLASFGLSNSQIRSRLCTSADRTAATGSAYTCGRLNAWRAVYTAIPTTTPTLRPTTTRTPTPSAVPQPGVTVMPITPPAHTPTVTAVPTVAVPGNTVINSGFEDGNAPWEQVSAWNYALIIDGSAHTGRRGALLSGFINGGDALFQTVTVPAHGKLTYYLRVTSDDAPTQPRDYLRVKLYTTNGTPIATLRTWSNATLWNIWIVDSVDMNAYAHQTLRIQFETITDSQWNTWFAIDDISLTP